METSRRSMLKTSLLALGLAAIMAASGTTGCEITVRASGTLIVTNDIVVGTTFYPIDALYVGRTEADALANERLNGSTLGFGESWSLLFADTGDWVVIARDIDGFYYRVTGVTVFDDLTSEVFISDYDYDSALTDDLSGGGSTSTPVGDPVGSLMVINGIDFLDSGDYTLLEIHTSISGDGLWTEQLDGASTVGWNEAAVVLDMPVGTYDVAAYDVNGNWYLAEAIAIYDGSETQLTLTRDSVNSAFSL